MAQGLPQGPPSNGLPDPNDRIIDPSAFDVQSNLGSIQAPAQEQSVRLTAENNKIPMLPSEKSGTTRISASIPSQSGEQVGKLPSEADRAKVAHALDGYRDFQQSVLNNVGRAGMSQILTQTLQIANGDRAEVAKALLFSISQN